MVKQLVGIDRDIIKDSFFGILIGIGILFLGAFVPGIGTIGIPSVPQSLSSDTSRFIVVVILASTFETLGFFDVIFSFIKDKLSQFTGIKIPFSIATILTSLVFSGFHYSAYGSGSSGAFFTAFLMGIVFCYERKFFNSNLPGIFTHAVLNFYIAFISLAVIV